MIPGNVLAGDFYRTKPFGGTLADAREVVGAASLAAAGDFDNNGLFDLIATEPNGQVWLIGGHLLTDRTLSLPASLDDLESETPTASHALSGFGAGVQATSAGDLNGDGLGDLVVWDDTDLYVFEAGE